MTANPPTVGLLLAFVYPTHLDLASYYYPLLSDVERRWLPMEVVNEVTQSTYFMCTRDASRLKARCPRARTRARDIQYLTLKYMYFYLNYQVGTNLILKIMDRCFDCETILR